MLLGLLHSGLAVVLRIETLSLTLYTVVVLLKQHLAATRPLASKVPAYSVLLLLKQHPESTATQLSASAVPTNPVLAPLQQREDLAATRRS
ncbi:hypothetical protein PF004_g33121 [Phytophthora fragariae]|uniref:Uncharacterized protein n=1 Tax=Phytophthora fragariae TaxID=53985 RepID=A0A6G0M4X6_9STRA|nr:hypothetical protein PF004_g33121 [Phytophthora fragariae]